MDLLAVANLAPAELVAYLDSAIATGNAQAPLNPPDLNASYLAALDRATVATARAKVWASRRTAAATARIPIYAGLQQSKSVGRTDASVAQPDDDYAAGISQAFEALSETGALLTRTAAAAENRTKGLRSK